MSIFAPSFYSSEPSFSGLFRLIDEFDNYKQGAKDGNNEVGRTGQGQRQLLGRHLPTFTPKFDLKETETAYELHGDLPGVDKKDVNIEFAGEHTLVIRGKVERSYTSDSSQTAAGDDNTTATAPADATASADTASNEKKPAEEKAPADATNSTTANTTTEVADASKAGDKQVSASAAPKAKYWISERSVGEFSRTFNFPTAVDHEAVKASLNDGVLTVTVPKAQKPQNRRVAVN